MELHPIVSKLFNRHTDIVKADAVSVINQFVKDNSLKNRLLECYKNKQLHEFTVLTREAITQLKGDYHSQRNLIDGAFGEVVASLNHISVLIAVCGVSVTAPSSEEALVFMSQYQKLASKSVDAMCLYESVLCWHLLRCIPFHLSDYTDSSVRSGLNAAQLTSDEQLIKSLSLIDPEDDHPVVKMVGEILAGLAETISNTFGLKSEYLFHVALADLAKHQNNHDRVYRHMLYYINARSTITEDLFASVNEVDIAHDICRALLLSPSAYAFSEVLRSSTLQSISPGSPAYDSKGYDLLRDLIVICNSGNIQLYQSFCLKMGAQIIEANLDKHADLITRKIRAFALLESIFVRPSRRRLLTFAEISKGCHIEIENVERLLLQCMSDNIIDGQINGLEGTFLCTRMMTRPLDGPKISNMATQFRDWAEQLRSAAQKIEVAAPQLLSQPIL